MVIGRALLLCDVVIKLKITHWYPQKELIAILICLSSA